MNSLAAPPPRRFTLVDAMLLVAASALGLVPARNFANYFVMLCRATIVAAEGRSLEGLNPVQIIRDPDLSFFTGTPDGTFIQTGDLPGRISFHWALFSDSGPQLGRQFARILCHVGWPFLVAWGIALLVSRWRRPRPTLLQILRQPGFWACCLPSLVAILGFTLHVNRAISLPLFVVPTSIAGAWLLLVLGAAWRPEPSWIDRTGRVLGVAWIISLPLWLWSG